MVTQSISGGHELDFVVPFAPKNAAPNNADQLDRAGQTILQLLHKAASVAEANSKHALDTAQKKNTLASASRRRRPDRGAGG